MEFHELADLIPNMGEDEYKALLEDIREHGLLTPITLFEGKILDGRHRYTACLEIGIEPIFTAFNKSHSPIDFVVGMNLKRRHLTESQKAVIALEILPLKEEEARLRMLAGKKLDPMEQFPQGPARDEVSKIVGVNSHYISDAKRIQQEAPDLLEEVKVGEKSISEAKRELRKRGLRNPEPLRGLYRVFYADPPWEYSNSGIINDSDNYGRAERHYSTMSIEELCSLNIREITEDNAVLFLWVTSPMLEDSFKVIRAWGFTYKTSFVWDKVKHNFGHYNSVRHEFLLVCTKGSCTPDVNELFDSVQSIARSETHSEKPDLFREIIEKLYLRRNEGEEFLELFGRKKVNGWKIYGNETQD